MRTIDETIETAQADYFWAPSDVNVVVRPEVTYTWAARDLLFFNSVVRVRPSLADLPALVDEVCKQHQGRASRWSLNPFSDVPELRAALQDAGYAEGNHHHAYVLRPDQYDRTPPEHVEIRPVTEVRQMIEHYAVRGEVFGVEGTLAKGRLENELWECTRPDARVARFNAYIEGEPVGGGGLTFFEDLDFAFIWAGGVRTAFRGQGAYTALLRARLDAAAARGIGLLGLYARDATSGPIVTAHGFERHGRMVHWNRAAS